MDTEPVPLVMVGPTAGHAPRKWLKVTPHDSGRVHPEQSVIECEAPDCHKPVVPARSHSFVITVSLATTGTAPVNPGAFQCGHEQHFTCSPMCALKAAVACMVHLLVEAERRRQLAALKGGEG